MWMSIRKAREYMGIGRDDLYGLIAQGALTVVYAPSGTQRIDSRECDAYYEGRKKFNASRAREEREETERVREASAMASERRGRR